MSLEVKLITSEEELQKAFEIRKVVFVDEQKVPLEEELDEFEKEAVHHIAYYNETPCGACRWRYTSEGVKLERFAVLKEFRGKKIGSALVSATLNSIKNHPEYKGQQLYLNSQIDATFLYERFDFKQVGEMFLECDIKHMKMVRNGL